MQRAFLFLMVVASLCEVACGNGGVDEGPIYTTGGGTTGGDGDGDETSETDEEPCAPAAVECLVDSDCCPQLQAASEALATLLCHPDGAYPNRWDCVEGECVNLGCDGGDAPCPGGSSGDGDGDGDGDGGVWECHSVGGVDHCIQPCNPANEESCDFLQGNHPGQMECTGQTDVTPPTEPTYFCQQADNS
jgi:hypothetical protein